MISEFVRSYIDTRIDKENICFVLLQGGHARGTATSTSDIDLLIAFSGNINNIRYDEFNGKLLELRYLDLEKIKSPKLWLERARFVFENESIYVYGDEEKYNQILNEVKMDKTEQLDLLIYSLKRCRTRGLIPESISPNSKEKRNYWIKREDNFSKNMFWISGIDYVIAMIYAINRVFLPSPKYRYYNVNKLSWLPEQWVEFTNNICKDGYLKITDKDYDILVEIVGKIINKINSIFDISISKEYMDKYSVSTTLPLFNENKDF